MSTAEEIRAQIASGKLSEAISRLAECLRESESELANEATALSGRLAEVQRRERRGELTTESAASQLSRLRLAALDLLAESEAAIPEAAPASSVFLSYRRELGADAARAVRNALSRRRIQAFLDVDDLGAGAFGPALIEHMDAATAVIAVLAPGTLARCSSEDDWVRKELGHALTSGKKTILLLMPGFEMPDDLPEELSALPQQNGVSYSHEFFDATIEKLARFVQDLKKA